MCVYKVHSGVQNTWKSVYTVSFNMLEKIESSF